jgi:hypothetical protein
MDIKIDTTALATMAEFNGLASRVPNATRAGLDAVAEETKAEKEAQQNPTYDRPIPRGKNGQPKWERTGQWRDNQVVQNRGADAREILTRGPAAEYEPRLARLPTGSDGVDRSNPASDNAEAVMEPKAPAIFDAAFGQALHP